MNQKLKGFNKVILFGLSLLLSGCSSEELISDTSGIAQKTEITEAKNWLEHNNPNLSILEHVQIIDWENAIVSSGDLGTVVEVPVTIKENLVARIGNDNETKSYHRLMFQTENKESFKVSDVMFFPKDKNFDNTNKEINFYSMDKKFDGSIIVLDVKNELTKPTQYEKGEEIKSIKNNLTAKVPFDTCIYLGWYIGGKGYENAVFKPIALIGCFGGGSSDQADYGGAHGGGSGSNGLKTVLVDKTLKDNPCLFGVYTKLGGVDTFQEYLKKFDSKSSVLDLKISVDNQFRINHPENLGAQAITTLPVNKTVSIIFNNDPNLPGNIMKFPQISIATNFIHEIIHAEINRQLSTASTDTNINPQKMSDSNWKSYINNIKSDFPQMFEYYSKYVLKTTKPSDFQHQYMADKYRGVIKDALKQYDGNQHNEDYYDALSWNGLKNTSAWNKLSSTEKTKILETIQTIYKNGTYCN